jgi:hypothetical protein
MKALIACEYSGRVRDAFRLNGHDAWSCDLLPTDANPDYHYQCDVREIINDDWDLIIAHPDCTYITNSGVCHLHKDASRWRKLWGACEFFKLFLNNKCEQVCIENPIPHKYALGWIGKKYDQIIHPWQFGHPESKSTCLWLKGLLKLKEENNVNAEMMLLPDNERQRLHYLPPSKDRWKIRSTTFQGIANGMANQWGAKS